MNMNRYKVIIEATSNPPPRNKKEGQIQVAAYDGEGMLASSILWGNNINNIPLHSIGTRVIDAGEPYGACRQALDGIVDLR